MLIEWTKTALKDYEFWKTNKKILSKINKLLESIENSHDKGEGSPERLKHYKGREV